MYMKFWSQNKHHLTILKRRKHILRELCCQVMWKLQFSKCIVLRKQFFDHYSKIFWDSALSFVILSLQWSVSQLKIIFRMSGLRESTVWFPWEHGLVSVRTRSSFRESTVWFPWEHGLVSNICINSYPEYYKSRFLHRCRDTGIIKVNPPKMSEEICPHWPSTCERICMRYRTSAFSFCATFIINYPQAV